MLVMLELHPGERTMVNVLCIEDRKLCAVDLWHIATAAQ